MRNKLTPIAASVGNIVRSNTRFALGIAVGVSVMFAGYAVSAVSSGSGSILGNASSQLLSQQTSVVADSIKADAEACATGTQDGSIGHSIQQAMQIHQTIAAAPVNVESLFDVNSDCFSGLNQIYDLSFSIPSLSSIIGAASDAVMKYAQKKVCTAVNQVSGLITSPINGIAGILGYIGSGLSGLLVGYVADAFGWTRVFETIIVIAVIVSLTVTSIIAARAGHLVLRKVLVRSLVVGIGTMAVSYVAGLVLF